MEWQLTLVIIFGSLLALMVTGLPVAFCFMLINIIGVFFLWGGEAGLRQLSLSLYESLTKFTYLPLPLFVLMGELMFQSGMGLKMVDALDKWLGRLPGRLGLLAVAAGTIFGAVSGASMASVAMLGSTLMPEMEKRGYKKTISLGTILGAGGLDLMIPPSNMAVILGAIAEISIGMILIAIIVPGLVMAALYAIYIIGICWLRPSLAPVYEVGSVPFSEKVIALIRDVLPLGFIVFLVTGIIFMGVATPEEAAAAGALGTIILAAAFKKLNWKVLKKAFVTTLEITIMIFMIITGATAFSQILVFSGGVQGLAELAASLSLAPIIILIAMQAVGLFLGMFMSVVAILMITLPMFMPVIRVLGINEVWFATIYLLNMGIGMISPPFGLNLFAMKGIAPPHITMGDIYRAALPYCYIDLIAVALIIAFPSLALWLPGLMH